MHGNKKPDNLNEFGGRFLRVKGHKKVMAHLMFGILVLTADQLFRLIT